MGQITYADKSAINVNPDVADTNKVNATDMNEIKSAVNDNNTKITGLIGTVLWSNPNPTSDFSAQNITLSSSDYDVLEIFYRGFNNSTWENSVRLTKGGNARLLYIAGTTTFYRNCQYTDDTIYSVANESANTNSRCIPLYIVGYKTNLFS